LPFLIRILELVLFEVVQNRLRFCLIHLNRIQMSVFSISDRESSHEGPSEASRVGKVSQLNYFTKFSCEKLCVIMMQKPIILPSKF
jgi:hypothetical protein